MRPRALVVIPATQSERSSALPPSRAGIQGCLTPVLAPGLRRDDGKGMQPCVYILASRRNGTLYVGVTSNLVARVWQHKENLVEGFTKRYGVHTLVWFELHETMESAIAREKAIKEWKRKWKLQLIEKTNPEWKDLCPTLL